LKRERGTHREAMGGEGIAGLTIACAALPYETLTLPIAFAMGPLPLPLQSAGEGQGGRGSLADAPQMQTLASGGKPLKATAE
jgi:hypothetical protein